jgi:hypothetical protein
VDEQGLQEAFLVRHQEMMHHAVAKIGGKDFAGFGTIGDEADGPSRSVGVRAQCLLQRQEVGLSVAFKGQGV